MKIAILLLSFGLFGCVSVHNISNSSLSAPSPTKSTRLIKAESTDWSIFRLDEPKLHVIDELRGQCLGGIVEGIETQLTSRDWIVFIEYRLVGIGHCTTN